MRRRRVATAYRQPARLRCVRNVVTGLRHSPRWRGRSLSRPSWCRRAPTLANLCIDTARAASRPRPSSDAPQHANARSAGSCAHASTSASACMHPHRRGVHSRPICHRRSRRETAGCRSRHGTARTRLECGIPAHFGRCRARTRRLRCTTPMISGARRHGTNEHARRRRCRCRNFRFCTVLASIRASWKDHRQRRNGKISALRSFDPSKHRRCGPCWEPDVQPRGCQAFHPRHLLRVCAVHRVEAAARRALHGPALRSRSAAGRPNHQPGASDVKRKPSTARASARV